MNRFCNFVRYNWRGGLLPLLIGFVISLLIAVSYESITGGDMAISSKLYGFISWSTSILPKHHFYILVVIAICSYLLWIDKVRIHSYRYKNSYNLKRPPLTIIDAITIVFLAGVFGLFFLLPSPRASSITDMSDWVSEYVFHPQKPLGLIINLFLVAVVSGTVFPKRPPSQADRRMRSSNGAGIGDDPIVKESEDRLDRGQFVDNLASSIIAFPLGSRYVFGLYGKWGQGKTSVLNLLENKICERSDLLISRFDPWYFKDTEVLIKNFFIEMGALINRSYMMPRSKRAFHKYVNLILKGSHFLGLGIDWPMSHTKDDTLYGAKEEIKRLVENTQRKIVVFIDDIDRLQKEEMLSVFKLVNLLSDFSNILFVLSFDPNIVRCKLSDPCEPGDYLAKIINRGIPLPRAPQRAIDDFLDDGINKVLDKL